MYFFLPKYKLQQFDIIRAQLLFPIIAIFKSSQIQKRSQGNYKWFS